MNEAVKRFNEAMKTNEAADKTVNEFMDTALLLAKELSTKCVQDPKSVTPLERKFMLAVIKMMINL
jgi:hypothetical protein